MKKLVFLLVGVAIIGQSCLKSNECDNCYNPPALFGFTLLPLEGGKSLIPDVYKLDTIKLFYLDGGVKTQVKFSYGTSLYLNTYLVSSDISVVSAGKNVKTFYLYLNNQDTDTIYFDCKIANDGCCTYYSYDSLSYNGKKMSYHPESRLQYVIKPQPIQGKR